MTRSVVSKCNSEQFLSKFGVKTVLYAFQILLEKDLYLNLYGTMYKKCVLVYFYFV